METVNTTPRNLTVNKAMAKRKKYHAKEFTFIFLGFSEHRKLGKY